VSIFCLKHLYFVSTSYQNHPSAVRVHAGDYKIERQTSPEGVDYLLMHLPYFLGTKIPEYISYFVENYSLETFQNEYKEAKE
jgi:hypothetical protein